jgi:hypothetical protein
MPTILISESLSRKYGLTNRTSIPVRVGSIIVNSKLKIKEGLLDAALETDILIKATEKPGPTALLRFINKGLNNINLEYAAGIVARYSDAKHDPRAKIKVFNKTGELLHHLEVTPIHPDQVPATV